MDGKYVSVYKMEIDGDQVMTVEVQKPSWLPSKPSVNQRWIRATLPKAIRSYMRRKAVVKV